MSFLPFFALMERLLTRLLKRPLRNVLLIALVLRLLAVFFAPGYLMVDDHFLVVEAGASWSEGEDYNNWLPWNQGADKKPHAANFAYVGTQFLVFSVLNACGIDDPKISMILIRLLHALYSLLIVYFGFKIAERLSNQRTAFMAGILLAALAWLPNFSVRQLVEMVCIPPLLWSSWILLKHREGLKINHILLAGVGIGLATGLRYQCGVFGIGLGLAFLVERNWKGAFAIGLSSLAVFFLTQVQDIFIWGEPFTQLRAYFSYNESHSGDYPNGPWYMYLLTLSGFLVPPLSLFLLFGFFKFFRRNLLLWLPTMLFLVFHSFFPNKQERFIVPIIPHIIVLGVLAWELFRKQSTFWQQRRHLYTILMAVFITLNTVGLAVLTFTYGKKSRVESMYYLYEQGDLQNFLAVFIDSEPMPPLFYTGSWESNYWFKSGQTDVAAQQGDMCRLIGIRKLPNYIVFYGTSQLEDHVAIFDEAYGGLEYAARFEPGLLDRILHSLNPRHNTLEVITIYRADPERICPN